MVIRFSEGDPSRLLCPLTPPYHHHVILDAIVGDRGSEESWLPIFMNTISWCNEGNQIRVVSCEVKRRTVLLMSGYVPHVAGT